jgi:hypothetical protein
LTSLQRWSHRLRREAPEPAAAAAGIRLARVECVAVSSEPTAPATVPGVVVEVSGARVRVERGADAATVAMVLAALGAEVVDDPARCRGVRRARPHRPALGFHRLSGVVTERLGREARSGALFVFFGKRRDAIKVLFFDGSGICLFYEKLDAGLCVLLRDERVAADVRDVHLDELGPEMHAAATLAVGGSARSGGHANVLSMSRGGSPSEAA